MPTIGSRVQQRMPAALLLAAAGLWSAILFADEAPPARKRVAAVVTEYRHNSHADVIVSRLFQTQTLDGQGAVPGMELMSLFTDQVPESDTSRKWSKQYGFRIAETIPEALTLGTGRLAVDGVLLVAEHGSYPTSETGQVQYPKRRLFEQVVKVFRDSGRSVPVFIDKHLADNWQDAKYIYDTARELKFPLMAGSSIPTLWRHPPADVRRDARLKQIVAVSYHTLDAYGFHGLEMIQCLAERRAGGETGIESVTCLTGDAVWAAGTRGVYDRKLLERILSQLKYRPNLTPEMLPDLVKDPVLFSIHYADGVQAHMLTLNGAVGEWSAAWRYDDDTVNSTLFFTQEARPFMHFAYLVDGVDKMMQTRAPSWPVERTLMTSGVLDALLISRKNGGTLLETPYLKFPYQSDWNWKEPPAPPPDRPIDAQ
ncbi:MAG: hypothetical protein EXS05_15050 [Planctomycetaceae bacterium]|nr:hypothetical protein [Planctomycetaceae bacterium]